MDIMPKKFWKQTYVLTRASLKSRYRNTFAGFVWVILNPLLMYGVQSLIFKKILKLETPNYYLFLLSGLLPWIFISQTVEICSKTFMNTGALVKAFPTHPMVFVTALVLDNFINFLAAFLLLLILMSALEPVFHIGLIFFPLAVLCLAAAVIGMSWLAATLQVFFRDTQFIVNFIISVMFFLTPVFYPMELIPEEYRWLVYINPFYHIILPFRTSIYDFELMAFLVSISQSLVVVALVWIMALSLWKIKKNEFYFRL